MGYTTDFVGKFKVDKKLDQDTENLLIGLATTRRMKRKVDSKYGTEGEFYIDGSGYCGQGEDDNIIDYNTPPETQPSLWCQWIYRPKEQCIEWDGGEKFYCYKEWILYFINEILEPRGYKLNGKVYWSGEDVADRGMISINDNIVSVKEEFDYEQ